MGKWCVYEHKFPNGKRYIGITSTDPQKRWRNGNGYETQPKMHNAIVKYGWDNIKHNILIDGIDREQAEAMERYLIASLDTIKGGYNVAIGGSDCGHGTYLHPYILAMVRGFKEWYPDSYDGSIAQDASDNRYDKQISDIYNQAAHDVSVKWGFYSTTDELEITCFWWHIVQWALLNEMCCNGQDTSDWVETHPPFERFSKDKPRPNKCVVASIFDF